MTTKGVKYHAPSSAPRAATEPAVSDAYARNPHAAAEETGPQVIWTVPILIGLGSAGGVYLSRRDPDRFVMAWVLFAYWAFANISWLCNVLVVLPAMDWIVGVMAMTAWWARRARWMTWVVQCIAARLALHVLDFLTDHAFLVSYIHALNASFVLMVVVVAFPGEGDAFDNLLRWLRRLRASLSTTRA